MSHSTENDACGAVGWNRDCNEVVCELPAGHDGWHVDTHEGWEWPPTRVIPPERNQM